jgi:hypothetical protein
LLRDPDQVELNTELEKEDEMGVGAGVLVAASVGEGDCMKRGCGLELAERSTEQSRIWVLMVSDGDFTFFPPIIVKGVGAKNTEELDALERHGEAAGDDEMEELLTVGELCIGIILNCRSCLADSHAFINAAHKMENQIINRVQTSIQRTSD